MEPWPNQIPESGGICLFEGRLKDFAEEVKREVPIKAVIGSLPRPNQAFWTLSALWAGWLWGQDAVEPYKPALRRRRYDWAWNTTALNAAFSYLPDMVAPGTPFFALLSEPEPSSLTSALTAASAAGVDLISLALRTEHDPIQIVWSCNGDTKQPYIASVGEVRKAIRGHLVERGEPASYLHVHTAGLIALTNTNALKRPEQEFDEAIRETHSLIQAALEEDPHFIHYSSGESVDTGLWGWKKSSHDVPRSDAAQSHDSLADRVEIQVVTFLQKHPSSIFLEVEQELYPHFPGLLTPSQGMIYAVLSSYANRQNGTWKLRAEDVASARREELKKIGNVTETIGNRLGYAARRAGKIHLWEQNGRIERAFCILASALVGPALTETSYPLAQTVLVIPGGRAALVTYKLQRDPALATHTKSIQVVKYRLLRALVELPVLTRETFEEQIAGDPLEKPKSQMTMF
jgi:hypothetical protein